jgi:hypothetical protein
VGELSQRNKDEVIQSHNIRTPRLAGHSVCLTPFAAIIVLKTCSQLLVLGRTCDDGR